VSEGRGSRSGRRDRSLLRPLAFAVCAVAVSGWTAGRLDDRTAGCHAVQPSSCHPLAPAVGRIEGSVVVSTALAARRPDFRIYADPGTGSIAPAQPRDPLAAELKNVVIYLDGDSATLPALPERLDRYRHGSIAQHEERFVPHVLPVLRGAVVQFPNDDNVYHNVFSLSSAAAPNGKGFDLGRYPKGSSKSWTFDTPGTVQVFCHIHSDMSAVVLVLSNPYFAAPGDDHHYVIDDVPEGDYTILGWHERAKAVVKRVHVAAGQTTNVDFNIPLPPVRP
jgi:plastocyanin